MRKTSKRGGNSEGVQTQTFFISSGYTHFSTLEETLAGPNVTGCDLSGDY